LAEPPAVAISIATPFLPLFAPRYYADRAADWPPPDFAAAASRPQPTPADYLFSADAVIFSCQPDGQMIFSFD